MELLVDICDPNEDHGETLIVHFMSSVDHDEGPELEIRLSTQVL